MPRKIVILGGNGFLGSRICGIAATRGHKVTSLSRSGAPVWKSVSASSTPPSWSSQVEWHKCDMLVPSSYRSQLQDADAVIHSTGILLEADYKGVVSGKESPIAGLQRAFSKTKQGARGGNPLERKPDDGEETLESGENDGQLTYELVNRDSAITLAREAHAAGAKTFVFMSAAAGAPILPKRYITTKRDAESTIASSFPQLRSIFIRPGFLYDTSRAFTLPIAASGYVGSLFNGLLGGSLSGVFGAAVEKPLQVDRVAEAIVEAIEDEQIKGVVDTGLIERLAEKGWRKSML